MWRNYRARFAAFYFFGNSGTLSLQFLQPRPFLFRYLRHLEHNFGIGEFYGAVFQKFVGFANSFEISLDFY